MTIDRVTVCHDARVSSEPPVRPDDLRISDAERSAVQDRLRRAHEVGQLDLGEFDERVRSVWAARTRGDLARVTADLPEPPPPGRRKVFSDTGGGVTMRVLTIVWSSLAAVNFVVWGLLGLTTGDFLHPWWVWVAVPPGIALAVLYVAGIGRPPRQP
ncbi:hypothetical protein GCM10009559_41190 [Pseudonocardia zijingensis]|uniref:DUF1707 domain-containing protein n=1 Tax=Pseudonocardia zijingensis TaxID=153376 RepID=A0ABP4B4H3_9PSEU